MILQHMNDQLSNPCARGMNPSAKMGSSKFLLGFKGLLALFTFTMSGGVSSADFSQENFLIKNGDRVVFYGDSITDNEWYPTLVETYVLTRYPGWRNQFFNRGQSGDNSGSLKRFERDVLALKPDFFTYNMGYNDGGYFGFSSARLEKWLSNITESVSMAKKSLPRIRMALVSPIPNEVRLSTDPRWVSHPVNPYVMLSYGHEEEKLARDLDVPFIDLGMLYGQSMGLGLVAAGETFGLSRDGVHPQVSGQTLIAYHFLRGLGALPDVASTEIQINGGITELKKSFNCHVENLAIHDGELVFQRKADSLPYPTPLEARPVAFLVRLDDMLNADILKVTGLDHPCYELYINNLKVADISAAELSDGLNLSRYPSTPMYLQSMEVMEKVRRKQVEESAFWRKYIMTGKADGNGVPLKTATADEVQEIAVARGRIEDLENECYKANTPSSQEFRLVPSDKKVERFAFLESAPIAQSSLDLTMSAVKADWNVGKLLQNEIILDLKNNTRSVHSGELEWVISPGWQVSPLKKTFELKPGEKVRVTYTASASGLEALQTPPRITARWNWDPNWPYPMTLQRQLDIIPCLSISQSNVKPEFIGRLADWQDATSLTLDQPAYISPAVPGKKAQWKGASDLSANFLMKWDESALYIAAIVRDESHVQNAPLNMTWSEDAVALSIFMTAPGKSDSRHEYFFAAYPDRDEILPTTKDAMQSSGSQVRFKSTLNRNEGTCFYEMAIPWERLAPFAPAAGKKFSLTVAVSDADAIPGKGFNYLSLTPGIHYGKTPSGMADITLIKSK